MQAELECPATIPLDIFSAAENEFIIFLETEQYNKQNNI